MRLKILSKSHHRNGVCGDPFNVFLFQDEDGTIKVAVDFGKSSFAVLQVNKLAANDIAFGSNSWRGDYYANQIRKLAANIKPASTPNSLFVQYSIPN